MKLTFEPAPAFADVPNDTYVRTVDVHTNHDIAMAVPADSASGQKAGQFDLNALAERSGVSIRTIRYYVQQGLLTPPAARGPKASYAQEHLDRLLAIKKFQQEHVPLAKIKERLASGLEPNAKPAESTDSTPPVNVTQKSSHWERIVLSDDVELHVRRPLSREATRRIEQLVSSARKQLDA